MIDATPKTVYTLDSDTYEDNPSRRKYVETEGIFYYQEIGSYYTHTERHHTSLYLDPATGLVVFDVSAYEKWLEAK